MVEVEKTPDPAASASPPMTPFVAFFSRYGILVLGAVLLIELGFHVFAVRSAKARDAHAPAAPTSVAPGPG